MILLFRFKPLHLVDVRWSRLQLRSDFIPHFQFQDTFQTAAAVLPGEMSPWLHIQKLSRLSPSLVRVAVETGEWTELPSEAFLVLMRAFLSEQRGHNQRVKLKLTDFRKVLRRAFSSLHHQLIGTDRTDEGLIVIINLCL